MQLACPACACTTAHRKLYSKNSCDILQCAECGLGRAECGGFDVHSYYTEDYFSGARGDGYIDYCSSEPVLRREFAHTVQFIRGFRKDGRLLEIGCAYGFFLEEARGFYDVGLMRTDIEEKVLEKLATSDKTTIVVERQSDGKMRVTSGSWVGEKVILRDQVLEARKVDGGCT
jgi:hypothetical protein